MRVTAKVALYLLLVTVKTTIYSQVRKENGVIAFNICSVLFSCLVEKPWNLKSKKSAA